MQSGPVWMCRCDFIVAKDLMLGSLLLYNALGQAVCVRLHQQVATREPCAAPSAPNTPAFRA